MSDVKHTPGPWHVAPEEDGLPLYVHAEERHSVVTEVAVIYHTDTSGERDLANAKLIAAAPGLADALERVFMLRAPAEHCTTGGCEWCKAREALRAAGRLP